MYVGIGLDGHELVDPHGARLTDTTEVIALQVNQHDVLGALLRVGGQLSHFCDVVALARTCACYGTRVDVTIVDAYETLR